MPTSAIAGMITREATGAGTAIFPWEARRWGFQFPTVVGRRAQGSPQVPIAVAAVRLSLGAALVVAVDESVHDLLLERLLCNALAALADLLPCTILRRPCETSCQGKGG